jgi:hypothetical protein
MTTKRGMSKEDKDPAIHMRVHQQFPLGGGDAVSHLICF